MRAHPPTHTTCDLHLHTWYSDGRASPADVLAQAHALGLMTIALTDHDNARGAREAAPLAARLGIELVPAIELTCRWDAAETAGWRGELHQAHDPVQRPGGGPRQGCRALGSG
ncbi:MAG: PHP domain-containing protein [Ktedonobacterales bacterium]